MIVSTSPGATRPSMATLSSTRLATGKKLAIEMSVRMRGKEREEEVVRLLSRQVEEVVGDDTFDRYVAQALSN